MHLIVAIWLLMGGQQLGIIEGTVVKLGTGEALANTRVGLIKAEGGAATSYFTTSGSDGRYRLTDLQPGAYRVLATRNDGYMPSEYGQSKPSSRGLPVTVGAGQTIKDIQIAMPPPSAINGRVFDRDRDPVGHAQVAALKTFYNREGKRGVTVVQSVQTNDLGEYRFFWLPPGQYYITARPEDLNARTVQAYIRRPEDLTAHEETSAPIVRKRILESGESIEEVHVPVYFPGTLDIQTATPVLVRPGDNIQGVDINLVAMPQARRIRGSVIDGATGQPATVGVVQAILQNSGPNITVSRSLLDAKGAFELTGLIPGTYYLFANPGPVAGFVGGRGGFLLVEVGTKDLENLSIVAPPAFSIPGKIVIEGKGELDITKFRFNIRRDPETFGLPFPQPSNRTGAPDPNAVSPDGTFTLGNLGAGDFRIGVSIAGSTSYVKSMRLGLVDVVDGLRLEKQPEGTLEIVIGTDTGGVSGSVASDTGVAVPNSLVALVPVSRTRKDLYKAAASDPGGRFDLKSVPPGEYKLFAWEDIESGAWMDPEFVRDFEARGTSIRLNSGSTENVQLTVIRARR